MLEKAKKIYNIVSSIFLTLMMLIVLLLVGSRFMGFHLMTVLSGSMEPTYSTGSLICVRPVDTDTLETGDVITYLISDDTLVTHRIAGLVPDENDPSITRFRTKGDANEAEDMTLVHEKNVVGTPIFHIPYAGYAVNYIQNPPGKYISVAVVSAIALVMFIPDLFAKDDEEEEAEEAQKEETSSEVAEPQSKE